MRRPAPKAFAANVEPRPPMELPFIGQLKPWVSKKYKVNCEMCGAQSGWLHRYVKLIFRLKTFHLCASCYKEWRETYKDELLALTLMREERQ